MVRIRPASVLSLEQRRQALALLFADFPDDQISQRIQQGLDAFENSELDPASCLTCWTEDDVVGILVCEILAGNNASLWPIRVKRSAGQLIVEDALFEHVYDMLKARGVKFAQSLVDIDDAQASSALQRNHFREVTRIWSLNCALLPDFLPTPPDSIRLIALSDTNRAIFQRTLLASFVESYDCPELNCIRTAEETLTGHLSGHSDLTKCWIAFSHEKPAGVLTLGFSDHSETCELNYLGVLPEARQCGLGRTLLEFAFAQAVATGSKGMSLLVDERNQTAIHLYKQYGFRRINVRNLFLRLTTVLHEQDR